MEDFFFGGKLICRREQSYTVRRSQWKWTSPPVTLKWKWPLIKPEVLHNMSFLPHLLSLFFHLLCFSRLAFLLSLQPSRNMPVVGTFSLLFRVPGILFTLIIPNGSCSHFLYFFLPSQKPLLDDLPKFYLIVFTLCFPFTLTTLCKHHEGFLCVFVHCCISRT